MLTSLFVLHADVEIGTLRRCSHVRTFKGSILDSNDMTIKENFEKWPLIGIGLDWPPKTSMYHATNINTCGQKQHHMMQYTKNKVLKFKCKVWQLMFKKHS